MRLTVTLPELKPTEYRMPEQCPCAGCTSTHFHRHGKKQRQIDDLQVKEVESLRFKCVGCGQTFWVHPIGVTNAQQSQRLKAMSTLLYVLGLSYGAVSDFLRASGARIGKTSSYYNTQAAGHESRKQLATHLATPGQRTAIGADGTYLKVKGDKLGIEVVVDPQTGDLLGLALTVSESVAEIEGIIREVAEQVEAEVLVSDDLESYKTIADTAGLAHQICQTHVIRNVDDLATEIREQVKHVTPTRIYRKRGRVRGHPKIDKDLNTVTWLVRDRPPDATQFLAHLYERYRHVPTPPAGQKHPPDYRMRRLIWRLWNRWDRIIFSDHNPWLDGTNNACERAIGWWIKERYRTMRGYKRRESIHNIVTLTAAMGAAEHYDMGQLYA